jgi:hypothetical protein
VGYPRAAILAVCAAVLWLVVAPIAVAQSLQVSTSPTNPNDGAPFAIVVIGSGTTGEIVHMAASYGGACPDTPALDTIGSPVSPDGFKLTSSGDFMISGTPTSHPGISSFDVCVWLNGPTGTPWSFVVRPGDTLALTANPPAIVAGQTVTVTASGTTYQPANLYVALEPAATACGPLSGFAAARTTGLTGAFSTPVTLAPAAGSYTICGWLNRPGNPDSVSASVPLTVGPPQATLSLSAPALADARGPLAVVARYTLSAPEFLFADVRPAALGACAANPSAEPDGASTLRWLSGNPLLSSAITESTFGPGPTLTSNFIAGTSSLTYTTTTRDAARILTGSEVAAPGPYLACAWVTTSTFGSPPVLAGPRSASVTLTDTAPSMTSVRWKVTRRGALSFSTALSTSAELVATLRGRRPGGRERTLATRRLSGRAGTNHLRIARWPGFRLRRGVRYTVGLSASSVGGTTAARSSSFHIR